MSIRKTIQKRAMSLLLAFTLVLGCTGNTAALDKTLVSDSNAKDSSLTKDSSMMMMAAAALNGTYYIPVNLYKYDRTVSKVNGVNTLKINQVTNEAAKAYGDAHRGTKVRALNFDAAGLSTYTGDWNSARNAIYPGIVSDTLVNGNLQWASGVSGGSAYQYVAADLFGPKNAANEAYRTTCTDVAFPLVVGTNGYYSFNSEDNRAVLNDEGTAITTRDQDISGQNAKFSPFYSGTGNPDNPSEVNSTYSFGMSMNIRFTIPEDGQVNGQDMQFSFTGDDDVWVFVDGKLVLDIGGVHQAKNGNINFNSGRATTDIGGNTITDIYTKYPNIQKDGQLHTLTLYYLERCVSLSNFRMSCNLLQTPSFEVGKRLEGESTGDETFRFRAELDDGTPLADLPFSIFNIDSNDTGDTDTTDEDGEFTLGANQKAVFSYSDEGVASLIADKHITVTELGAEDYDTTWETSLGGDTDAGNGKTADITAPSVDETEAAQTASVTFTNQLSEVAEHVSVGKSAAYTGHFNSGTGAGERTYDITLSASSTDIQDAEYTEYSPQSPPAEGPYYSDEGNTQITYRSIAASDTYEWYTGAGGTGTQVTVTGKYGINPLYHKTTTPVENYYKIYDDGSLNSSKSYYVGSSHIQVQHRKKNDGTGPPRWRDANDTVYTPNEDRYDDNTQFYNLVITNNDSYDAIDYPDPPDVNAEYYIRQGSYPNYLYPRVYLYTRHIDAAIVWSDMSGNPVTPAHIYVCTSAGGGVPVAGATIKDYIDPRFEVVDENGDAYDDNDTIPGTDGVTGTLYKPLNENAYVEWTGQTITTDSPGWSQVIHIRAKLNFIGGNDIPTNADGSGVFNSQDVELAPFVSPTVNVPVWFTVNSDGENIFYGENIRGDGLPESMFDENDAGQVNYITDEPTGSFSYEWDYNTGAVIQGGALSDLQSLTPSEDTDYKFKVTFTPNPDTDGSASARSGGGPAVGPVIKSGTYAVTVTKGELDLTKYIVDKDEVAAQNPGQKQFFTFKIDRYAPDNTSCSGSPLSTSYEVIYVDHGVASGTKTITNLPHGCYKVTEIPNSAWRYGQHGDVQYSSGQYLGRNTGDPTTFTQKITAGVKDEMTNEHWISGKDSVTNVFVALAAS